MTVYFFLDSHPPQEVNSKELEMATVLIQPRDGKKKE